MQEGRHLHATADIDGVYRPPLRAHGDFSELGADSDAEEKTLDIPREALARRAVADYWVLTAAGPPDAAVGRPQMSQEHGDAFRVLLEDAVGNPLLPGPEPEHAELVEPRRNWV